MIREIGICFKVRVIHIVENLDRGAVENWLVRMLVHSSMSGANLDWTFYCARGQPGRLDEIAINAGGRIVFSPYPMGSKWRFLKALRTELASGGYDVVHCHHDLISGVYLAATAGLSIRKRIVHVHNADEDVLTPHRLKQNILRPLLRTICLTASDLIAGISNHTLDTFLGGRKRRPGRDIVHYYGIDPGPFAESEKSRIGLRAALGIPTDAHILLFAGRLVPEKNPLFVLDVLKELRKLDSRAVAVFAGAGSLEAGIQKRAQQLGLDNAIHMLGFRSDVADIMCISDWFILPRPERPMEGFGIAVVEAQLAGLRLLLSQGIPDDPILPSACYARLSLQQGAKEWASSAIDLLNVDPPTTEDMLVSLRNSPFDMEYAMNDLISLHSQL